MAERLRPFEEVFGILSPDFDIPARIFNSLELIEPRYTKIKPNWISAILVYCKLVPTSLNPKWFR